MPADDRLGDFEARLAALRHKMERGLIDRAATLRELAAKIDDGDAAARKQLKTESHKLRGVAGSYGHDDLTELAGQLEQRASVSPPATVSGLARELAALAEARGRASMPPPPPPPASASDPVPRAARAPSGPLLGARARASKQPGAGADPARAPLRVLATDDDPVTQRLLKLTLEQVGGFEATIVSSAAKALELLRTQPFDIVVSDAMMPDMNGRELRAQARSEGITTPIVILSAASPEELGWRNEAGGPDGWLRKPFKPTDLVRAIEEIVTRAKSSG